ncbi:hypothetical protein BsWGS_26968 [Bradybaena similaris]
MERVGVQKRLLLLIACFGICFVSAILVIIGLCTNNWVEIRNRNLYRNDITVHFGLHRVCWTSSDRCNNPGNNYDQQKVLPSVQGILITGGFITVIAGLAAMYNLLQHLLGRSNGLISVGCAAAAGIGGIMVLVGAIVFATKVKVRTEYISVGFIEWLGFSFGLTVTAGILMIIAAVLGGLTALSSAQQKFNHM